MNIAAKVAAAKLKHPDDFCGVKGCLWRIHTARGVSPCRNHPSGASEAETAVQAGNLEDSSPRDVGRGASIPTARSLAEREARLASHDPRKCGHPRCNPDY